MSVDIPRELGRFTPALHHHQDTPPPIHLMELLDKTACEWAAALRRRDVTAVELTTAALTAIEQRNPHFNAVVTQVPEPALQAAAAADAAADRGEWLGPLHGLPVVHKDIFETAGIRTTFGSPLFREHVPRESALIVQRQSAAGAICVGKSNTPEFAAGSQTFNRLFGATANPYNRSRTCGGSSGGAAVAVAAGLSVLADGSDFGASLRNPSSFCNVVGFRPTAGIVPAWPDLSGWFPMHVQGPVTRTVADAALMMSVISGPDERAPLSLGIQQQPFREPISAPPPGLRVAWGLTALPFAVDSEVLRVLSPLRNLFEHDLRCHVRDASPELTAADTVFRTFRAWRLELGLGSLLDKHPQAFKPTLAENIRAGQSLSGPELGRAEVLRTRLHHRMREFFRDFDYLVWPTCQVLPFGINEEYPSEIAGEPQSSYLDWMRSCYYITVTGCPAISLPGGFSSTGLPVGLQIIGRWHDDMGVLRLAAAVEQATSFYKLRPALPG